MAGAGYKLFNTGDVLTAAEVNTYLQEQSVMVFANAAARTSALSGVLAEGMITYLKDTDAVEKYNGTSWIAMQPGDIEGVTATSPLTGGGTSGTVTIGIQDGTTAQKGAVQLIDSVSSTSTTTAATPNSVKTTYDLVTSTTTLATNANVESSFLGRINGGPIAGENLMKQGVFWIDALQSTASGQSVSNLGWAGSALNAQAGSAGTADSNDPTYLSWSGTNYLYLPGVAGNYASTPDSAAVSITGDLDLRVKVAMDDWTPSANQVLIAKYNTSNISYLFRVNTDGTLGYIWSTDGTSTTTKSSSPTATGITDGSIKWVRVTHDVNNGASGNDVKFFTSDDGTNWTQLGGTVITAGTTSIYDGNAILEIGSFFGGGTSNARGKFFRAQVLNGIDGTVAFDADFSIVDNGNATSFFALTGQTVTINSGTSGMKSTVVTNPLWLLGTDDYFEVSDSSYIDFTGTESFTLIAVMRSLATAGTNDAIIAKKADTTNTTAGWSLTNGASTALAPAFQVGDGAAGATAVGGSRSNGALTVLGAVRNVATDDLTVYVNGTAGTPVTDATTTTSANAEVLRIGRLSGAGTEYSDMQLMAAAVFRRALTSTEITTITNYYSARYGS